MGADGEADSEFATAEAAAEVGAVVREEEGENRARRWLWGTGSSSTS